MNTGTIPPLAAALDYLRSGRAAESEAGRARPLNGSGPARLGRHEAAPQRAPQLPATGSTRNTAQPPCFGGFRRLYLRVPMG
jgi:hypothetical protein